MMFHIQNPRTPLPLQLELIGVNHHQEPIVRPNGMPFYQWFYCVKGQGEFIVNGQRSLISHGQGLLIYPEISHVYQAVSADWMVHFIGFGGSACKEILHALQMYETGVYHLSIPEIFERHLQTLCLIHDRSISDRSVKDSSRDTLSQSSEQSLEFSKECYSFLLDLCPSVSRIYPNACQNSDERITTVITYIEEHYAEDLSLDELAAHAGLSREYLCALFKQTMQQTLSHFLLGIRLSRARALLLTHPDMKILDVAHACGFQSPSYFGKMFKREIGVTPELFRKSPSTAFH